MLILCSPRPWSGNNSPRGHTLLETAASIIPGESEEDGRIRQEYVLVGNTKAVEFDRAVDGQFLSAPHFIKIHVSRPLSCRDPRKSSSTPPRPSCSSHPTHRRPSPHRRPHKLAPVNGASYDVSSAPFSQYRPRSRTRHVFPAFGGRLATCT